MNRVDVDSLYLLVIGGLKRSRVCFSSVENQIRDVWRKYRHQKGLYDQIELRGRRKSRSEHHMDKKGNSFFFFFCLLRELLRKAFKNLFGQTQVHSRSRVFVGFSIFLLPRCSPIKSVMFFVQLLNPLFFFSRRNGANICFVLSTKIIHCITNFSSKSCL